MYKPQSGSVDDGEPKRKTQTETMLLCPSEPEIVNKAVWTGNRMESDRSAYWSNL